MAYWESFDLWRFLAGLGIFLLGMLFVEESLKNLAGRAFKKFLRKHTSNPIKGILSGTAITALLQSSSVVTLMLLAFVGAEIMTLRNAIGVIFGSNLGTTFTGWIVAVLGFKLSIESFALPMVAIGGLLRVFLNGKGRWGEIGQFLVGFGFIFLGLDYMKTSIEQLAQQFDLGAFADLNPYLFFPIGFIFTAIIQSSSASMVITLSALSAGMISLPAAMVMVVGSDLGTTITTIFGGLNGTPVKKQVALSHFLFNLITDLLALALVFPLIYVIKNILGLTDPLFTLVAFHSSFNLLGIIILLPLIGPFSRFVENRFKGENGSPALFIHKVPPDVPDAAMEALKNEIIHLIDRVFVLSIRVLKISPTLFSFKDKGEGSRISQDMSDFDLYANIKQLEGEIVEYYLQIPTGQLSEEESARLNQAIHAVRNAVTAAKGIKDIHHNIKEFEKSVNDHTLGLFELIKGRENEWYLDLHRLFHSDNPAIYAETLNDLESTIQLRYDSIVREIYQQARADRINELEISTLLNVNRELFHTNRSLHHAVKDTLIRDDLHASYKQEK